MGNPVSKVAELLVVLEIWNTECGIGFSNPLTYMPMRLFTILWSQQVWVRRTLHSSLRWFQFGGSEDDRRIRSTCRHGSLLQPRATGFSPPSRYPRVLRIVVCHAAGIPWRSKLGRTLTKTVVVRSVKRSRLSAQCPRSFLDSMVVVFDHQCVCSTRSARIPYRCVHVVYFARGHRMGQEF